MFKSLVLLVTLSELVIFHDVLGKHAWYERNPDINDPCVLKAYGYNIGDLPDIIPDLSCSRGGLIWMGTWGRLHLHFIYDYQRKQEFQVCLVAGTRYRDNGESQVVIWNDVSRRFWEPVTFPNWAAGIIPKEHCRKSIDGAVDWYVEPAWGFPYYVLHATWSRQIIVDDNDTCLPYDMDHADTPPHAFDRFTGDNILDFPPDA